MSAEWIWLDPEKEGDKQYCRQTAFAEKKNSAYCVARFQKTYEFDAEISFLRMDVSGDCRFRFWVNGEYAGMGPTFAGGDWERKEDVSWHFSDRWELPVSGKSLKLLAEVQLSPTLLADFSSGRGGFYLSGSVELQNGETKAVETDESWLAQVAGEWESPFLFDDSLSSGTWNPARISPREKPEPSAIPVNEKRLIPVDADGNADRIYTGNVFLDIDTDGPCEVVVTPYEVPGMDDKPEIIRVSRPARFIGFHICSIGGIRAEVTRGNAKIKNLSILATRYPSRMIGKCETDDEEMNLVMRACEHTLDICCQSIHLDSPRHMEPLGCTGDYYVESLMGYYVFDDQRLSRFDITRTARILELQEGRMFHTSYSLIWVSMLRDYIRYTGDTSVLKECEKGLRILLERFHGYENGDGVLDNPPDYMFVDWVEIEGYSMHHPPKALGQTFLNAMYFRALTDAAALFDDETYSRRAEKLRKGFEKTFWNEERKLYTSGTTDSVTPGKWQPENSKKEIYSLHANAAAVACGIPDRARGREILRRALTDPALHDFQPYFAHFVLQAIWEADLFEEFGFDLLKRWIPMVQACPTGLAEGWILPTPGYSFDHSHAWGGCARYWLPRALLGLRIREDGFKKISLKPIPSPYARAEVCVPTPMGTLFCALENGKIADLRVPEGVECTVEA